MKYKDYEKKNCLLLIFLRQDLFPNSELYKERADVCFN